MTYNLTVFRGGEEVYNKNFTSEDAIVELNNEKNANDNIKAIAFEVDITTKRGEFLTLLYDFLEANDEISVALLDSDGDTLYYLAEQVQIGSIEHHLDNGEKWNGNIPTAFISERVILRII